MSSDCWTSLGLASWLAGTCTELGLSRPTPIQRECIGPALAGRDVLGSAETGSGKTAAFALPVLQALSDDPYGVFAVVLSPARELAMQIYDQFVALGARIGVRVAVVVGGVDMMHQALELAERPHIVIATPGRLADHLRSSGTAVTMRKTRFLVIDEADRLLELGYADDLSFVLSHLPSRRQTLLFSATMSGALHKLQALALTKPHVADLAAEERVPSGLAQKYVFVPANVRDVYLVYLINSEVVEKGSTAIVFTSSCRSCEVLATTLRALGIDAAPLHSQQPQARRLAAIGKFKQGSLRLLVATDVAARGIDIPACGVVLNHNVPAMPKDYIHRCGRTARAGRAGVAVTFATQYDVERLLAIEQHVGAKLETLEPDEESVLKLLQKVATARRAAIMTLDENGFLEREKERRQKRKMERLESAGGLIEEDGLDELLCEDEGGAAGEAASSLAVVDASAPLASAKEKRGKKENRGKSEEKKEKRKREEGGRSQRVDGKAAKRAADGHGCSSGAAAGGTAAAQDDRFTTSARFNTASAPTAPWRSTKGSSDPRFQL